jgi:hypothetical protein
MTYHGSPGYCINTYTDADSRKTQPGKTAHINRLRQTCRQPKKSVRAGEQGAKQMQRRASPAAPGPQPRR